MSDITMNDAYEHNFPPDASPQAIWALLHEVAKSQKEFDLRMEKYAQEAAERKKEADERKKEADDRQRMLELEKAKTEKTIRELGIRFGDLGNRFGELAEHLVAPSIEEKFNEQGFRFKKVSQNQKLIDPSGKRYAEIDIILESNDTIMAVEVKSKPLQKDVDTHITRIQLLREKADANDTKRFRGAVAGAIMLDEVREYIHENGLYAIEQTGDTVKISAPEGFKPREW